MSKAEDKTKEELVQELRESQEEGDTLAEVGPNGITSTTGGPDGATESAESAEPVEELIVDMMEMFAEQEKMHKRQSGLEQKYTVPQLMASSKAAQARYMAENPHITGE
jgi:hypothetical protein